MNSKHCDANHRHPVIVITAADVPAVRIRVTKTTDYLTQSASKFLGALSFYPRLFGACILSLEPDTWNLKPGTPLKTFLSFLPTLMILNFSAARRLPNGRASDITSLINFS